MDRKTSAGQVLELDIERIMQMIPHRYPFLLVDRVAEIIPHRSAIGVKNVTFNEHFFVRIVWLKVQLQLCLANVKIERASIH